MLEEKFAALLSAALKGPHPDEEDSEDPIETVGDEEEEQTKVAEAQPAPSKVSSSNFFQHPDTHPLVLDLALLRRYGPDFLLWEPETLEMRVPQDFRTPQISYLNMAKIQACKVLHLVDTYWTQWEVFCWITAVLNGQFPDFQVMQVPTTAQCAVSVDVVKRLREDVEWSSEVKAFIEQVLRFDGLFLALPPLDFVKVDADGYIVRPEEIRAAWPSVQSSGLVPEAETVTNEQLRRLLVVHQAVEDNRRDLRYQLPLVTYV